MQRRLQRHLEMTRVEQPGEAVRDREAVQPGLVEVDRGLVGDGHQQLFVILPETTERIQHPLPVLFLLFVGERDDSNRVATMHQRHRQNAVHEVAPYLLDLRSVVDPDRPP